MDARLTWNRNRRRRGDEAICAPKKGYNFVICLVVFLVCLIGIYVLISWDNVRCLNHFDDTEESSHPPQNKGHMEGRLQDRVIPLVLVTVVVAIMSILHVSFKPPAANYADIVPQRKTSISESGPPKTTGRTGGKLIVDDDEELLARETKQDMPTNYHDTTISASHLAGDKYSPTEDIQKKFENEGVKTQTSTQLGSKANVEGSACGPERSGALRVEDPHVSFKEDAVTQTEETLKSTVAVMCSSPGMVDASVNTYQKYFKLVRNYGTTTSGPFMKKLRRAQRLLKEARTKARLDKRVKVLKWRAVIDRYRDRLNGLSETLEKKDRLLGHTVLTRFLSEHDIRDLCSAIRLARDRLQTQIKLNSALRDVVESRCDSGPSTAITTSTTTRQTSQGVCR